MGVRVYQRIAPRTGISMPFWLAIPVYALWFCVWLAVVGAWAIAVVLMAIVRFFAVRLRR